MFVKLLNKDLPIHVKGNGRLPLIVLGPASLFEKDQLLSPALKSLFTIYFVDMFSKLEGQNTPNIDKLTLDDFVWAIEGIRLALNKEKIALFAHSASGVLAMKYAQKYPGRVSCNLIVATAPFGELKKKTLLYLFFIHATLPMIVCTDLKKIKAHICKASRKFLVTNDLSIVIIQGERNFSMIIKIQITYTYGII